MTETKPSKHRDMSPRTRRRMLRLLSGSVRLSANERVLLSLMRGGMNVRQVKAVVALPPAVVDDAMDSLKTRLKIADNEAAMLKRCGKAANGKARCKATPHRTRSAPSVAGSPLSKGIAR